MNSSREPGPDPGSRDLFSLSSASMDDLLAALLAAETIADEGGSVPPRSLQIAEFVTAEAVRLIRLGTRTELTDAAVAVSHSLLTPPAKQLRDRRPEAYRLVAGASIVLAAAAAPSSGAGELTVLRSWNGMARKAVGWVSLSEGQSIPRAELREKLAVDESYLSHLLTDLEAASLIVRIKHGRSVTVHLGPAGRGKHVQELLPGNLGGDSDDPRLATNKRIAHELFQCLFDVGDTAAKVRSHQIRGWRQLEASYSHSREPFPTVPPRVDDAVAEGDRVICRIAMSDAAQMGDPGYETEPSEHHQVWAVLIEHGKPVEVRAWDSRPEPAYLSGMVTDIDLTGSWPSEHEAPRFFGSSTIVMSERRDYIEWVDSSPPIDRVDNFTVHPRGDRAPLADILKRPR